jgi:hypothetical protein
MKKSLAECVIYIEKYLPFQFLKQVLGLPLASTMCVLCTIIIWKCCTTCFKENKKSVDDTLPIDDTLPNDDDDDDTLPNDDDDTLPKDEVTCPICLFNKPYIILNCGHTVCDTCIDGYEHSDSTLRCALCRCEMTQFNRSFFPLEQSYYDPLKLVVTQKS